MVDELRDALAAGAIGFAISPRGAISPTIFQAESPLAATIASTLAIALAFDTIDLGWLCSTQPDIAMNGFIVLSDDLQTQPGDALAPIVRNELDTRVEGGVDAIATILDPISARITTETLRDLGVKVTVEQQDIAAVAGEFLSALAPTD